MRVYFSASVSGRVYNDKNDRLIVQLLKEITGDDVYSEHIFNDAINKKYTKKGLSPNKVLEKSYLEIMDHIKVCDLMVAEISFPSVAVGHEISYALSLSKQVVLLHLPGKSSRLMEGIRNVGLNIVEYTQQNLKERLKYIVEIITKNRDVRFNFFIPNNIFLQLEKITKDERINKSELIRKLVEKDMKKNKRYQKMC